jgi:hypothetical protein
MIQQTGMTVHRWGYVAGPVHRSFHEDVLARDAFERAERLNAVARALSEGFMPVEDAPITGVWEPLSEVDIEVASRVDRDAPDWLGVAEETIAAEEARRREWHRDARTLRVSFQVHASPERPTLLTLDERAHTVLAREGMDVLDMKANAVALCGGALRRHQFPPRDAAWLRDGAISAAHCSDCDQDVTRAELLERAAHEEKHGTCHVDGDAFVMAGTGNSGLICPTCTAALRR